MNYRNRPFLVLSHTYIPTPGQDSRVKNFAQSADWTPLENVVITDRPSNTQINRADLVLDLLENKIIKNRQGELDGQELFNAVISRFSREVKAGLAEWAAKSPENLARVAQLAEAKSSDQ